MGELEEEFKTFMGTQIANWLNHPDQMIQKLDAEVDKITNLAEARVYIKKQNRLLAKAIWYIIQLIIQGR